MSPIVGLTDQVVPAFPRLGKLRKGGEKGEKGFGPELSYFRFTSERADVAKAFVGAYGKEPTMLRCFMPYARLEDNWDCWKEKWAGGGMVHRCDGETMNIWLDGGRYHRGSKPCPYAGRVHTAAERKKDPACEEVGRLVVILPELWAEGYIGYVTLETHSIHDIRAIQACLMAVAEARANNELGLRGIEFVLRRVRETISTPGQDGNRVRREKWLVKLEPAADWARLRLLAARDAAMSETALIEAPADVVGDLDTMEELVTGEPPEMDEADWKVLEEQARNGGQATEQPSPLQEQTPPPPDQGHGGAITVARPASPETVKGWLVSKATQGSPHPVDQRVRGAALDALEKLFYDRPKEERATARHKLLAFAFGNESTTALTDGQARALLAWAQVDGKTSNVAAEEARLLVAAPQQPSMLDAALQMEGSR